MAGAVGRVVEEIDDRRAGNRPIKKVRIEWTSDDTTGDLSKAIGNVNGFVIGLETKPGTPAPNLDYDVTLEDELAYDVLEGRGADRSNSATEKVVILSECAIGSNNYAAHPAVCGTLTFKIASAGNSKKGTAILYFR